MQGRRAHRVVRADAARSAVSGLRRSVQHGLDIQPPASRPGPLGVAVADARCGDIPNERIAERGNHTPQVVRRRYVVRVELGHHVVEVVTPPVIEVGEVPLLAAGPPWPGRPVVGGRAIARGDPHPIVGAPLARLDVGTLVRQPGVKREREFLDKHRFERLAHHLPWLTGRLRDDHCRPQLRERQIRVWPLHAPDPEEEPQREEQHLDRQQRYVDRQGDGRDPMPGLQAPRPRPRRQDRPRQHQTRQVQPLATAQRVNSVPVSSETATNAESVTPRMILVDGRDLARLMIDHGKGVLQHPDRADLRVLSQLGEFHELRATPPSTCPHFRC